MTTTAKSVILAELFDSGNPKPEFFRTEEKPAPELGSEEGSILFQVLAMSADPYLRLMMRSGGDEHGAFKPGSPISGYVAGKVIGSNSDKWSVGDLFGANLPFTTIQLLTAETLKKTQIWKLTGLITEDKITYGIGPLGMVGATAWGGVTQILQPKKGETLFVSAAAGAVGGFVGQIAKNVYGAKVVGSCGGPEKCKFITETFGFDKAIDYKTAPNLEALSAKLKEAAPEGIDMYFENVGGDHWYAATAALNQNGRIAVCGAISSYGSSAAEKVTVHIMDIVFKRQKIQGLLSVDYMPAFLPDMAQWLKEGKLHVEETVFEGIDRWGEGFCTLFASANRGKVVIKV